MKPVKSARGQAQSRTLRVSRRMGGRASVLDCARRFALSHAKHIELWYHPRQRRLTFRRRYAARRELGLVPLWNEVHGYCPVSLRDTAD